MKKKTAERRLQRLNTNTQLWSSVLRMRKDNIVSKKSEALAGNYCQMRSFSPIFIAPSGKRLFLGKNYPKFERR